MFQRTTLCGPDATSPGLHPAWTGRHSPPTPAARTGLPCSGGRFDRHPQGRRRPPWLSRRAAPQGLVERSPAWWPGLLPPHGSTTGFSLAIGSCFCCHDSTLTSRTAPLLRGRRWTAFSNGTKTRVSNWDAEELIPMPIPRKRMIQLDLHRPMVRGAPAACHGRLWGCPVAICTHGKQITAVAVTGFRITSKQGFQARSARGTVFIAVSPARLEKEGGPLTRTARPGTRCLSPSPTTAAGWRLTARH